MTSVPPVGARINPFPGMDKILKTLKADSALEERIAKLEKENEELRERLRKLEESDASENHPF